MQEDDKESRQTVFEPITHNGFSEDADMFGAKMEEHISLKLEQTFGRFRPLLPKTEPQKPIKEEYEIKNFVYIETEISPNHFQGKPTTGEGNGSTSFSIEFTGRDENSIYPLDSLEALDTSGLSDKCNGHQLIRESVQNVAASDLSGEYNEQQARQEAVQITADESEFINGDVLFVDNTKFISVSETAVLPNDDQDELMSSRNGNCEDNYFNKACTKSTQDTNICKLSVSETVALSNCDHDEITQIRNYKCGYKEDLVRTCKEVKHDSNVCQFEVSEAGGLPIGNCVEAMTEISPYNFEAKEVLENSCTKINQETNVFKLSASRDDGLPNIDHAESIKKAFQCNCEDKDILQSFVCTESNRVESNRVSTESNRVCIENNQETDDCEAIYFLNDNSDNLKREKRILTGKTKSNDNNGPEAPCKEMKQDNVVSEIVCLSNDVKLEVMNTPKDDNCDDSELLDSREMKMEDGTTEAELNDNTIFDTTDSVSTPEYVEHMGGYEITEARNHVDSLTESSQHCERPCSQSIPDSSEHALSEENGNGDILHPHFVYDSRFRVQPYAGDLPHVVNVDRDNSISDNFLFECYWKTTDYKPKYVETRRWPRTIEEFFSHNREFKESLAFAMDYKKD